jgi:hypothetical protein
MREQQADWYRKNRDKIHTANKAAKYGLTEEQLASLMEAAGGVCAICRQPESYKGRTLSVDHCHETGRVRGVLCSKCNAGIGFLGDKPETVAAALAYLQRGAA